MIKYVYLSIIFYVLSFVLVGCSEEDTEPLYREEYSQETIFSDFVYDQENAQICSYNSQMSISETGYYYIINNTLYFYNVETDVNSAMCSRVDCMHENPKCDAYVYSTTSSASNDLSCNCLDNRIFYYNEKLYMIERTNNNEFYLYQYNSAFNDRRKITKLASFEEEQTIVMNANISIIADGYLYYYVAISDAEYAQKDYMINFLCKRVKLEKDAVPETLGEFEFPGDYAMMRGDSNGLGILVVEDDIYFVAGGTARWYTTNNPVQYRITKYDTISNKFDILWTYTGDETTNIWGENTGSVGWFSGGNCMYMDKDANIYMVTATDKVRKNIICYDITDKASHIVYTTKHDELQNIKFDGEHFYFFETDAGTSSNFTILDTEGKMIATKELEYTEEYLDIFEKYKEMYPELEVVMPVADDNNIIIYGMDDRGILIGCNANADVFKGLTSVDIRTYHNLEKNDFENDITVGVGIFLREQFMNGEDTELKQIYQYEP